MFEHTGIIFRLIIGLLIMFSVGYDLGLRMYRREKIGAFTIIIKGLLFIGGLIMGISSLLDLLATGHSL